MRAAHRKGAMIKVFERILGVRFRQPPGTEG